MGVRDRVPPPRYMADDLKVYDELYYVKYFELCDCECFIHKSTGLN